MKVSVRADENIFVKVSLNKELLVERFLREDEVLDAVFELIDGKNILQKRWVNVVFKECYLDEHIHPDGWCEMHGFCPENERFFEYRNFGPGSSKQNPKRPQLDEIEAERYTKENVLKEWKIEI